jgi:hypothetical protein
MCIACLLAFILAPVALPAQRMAEDGYFRIARVKYRGGGDWYNDPSALTNLIIHTRSAVPAGIRSRYDDVELGSRDIFTYPFLFLTGHGNISISNAEAVNLRKYLDAGGFLYIDDDYGLDPFIRPLLKRVFPDGDLVELPFSHPIYAVLHPFRNGLPKIHEHDGKPPQGLGIIRNGRLVVFYSYESNLADGWADADIHGLPSSLRTDALRMGSNILAGALLGAF